MSISDIHYQQRNLPFFTPTPAHNHTETSKEAAVSIEDKLGPMCRVVRSALADAPDGLTCEEVEVKTGLKHQTASARLKQLQDAGYAEWRPDKNGNHRKRPNSSGRNAKVYFFSYATPTRTH